MDKKTSHCRYRIRADNSGRYNYGRTRRAPPPPNATHRRSSHEEHSPNPRAALPRTHGALLPAENRRSSQPPATLRRHRGAPRATARAAKRGRQGRRPRRHQRPAETSAVAFDVSYTQIRGEWKRRRRTNRHETPLHHEREKPDEREKPAIGMPPCIISDARTIAYASGEG